MKINKYSLVAAGAIIIIIAVTLYLSLSLKKTPQVSLTAAKREDVTQSVSVDGTVNAAQDLSLSFQQGGVVSQVYVSEGDQVKQGQVLVRLNSGDASAALNQAEASLASAQANYDKVINGATGANIDVATAAVNTAQTTLGNANKNLTAVTSQQSLLVQNALTTLLNSNLSATSGTNNTSSGSPVITGSYNSQQQGQYQIKLYSSGLGMRFTLTGMETDDGLVSTSPVALGKRGLFIQFTSLNLTPNDTWTINIPNTQGANYLTNYNAYQASLQTQNQALVAAQAAVDNAQAALAQAKANLQLMQTAARPEDVAAAQAQVQTAQAQVQGAQNTLSKNDLIAPIDGVITSVDAKVGQTVAGSTLAPGPDAIQMISNQQFQIESFVSENDIGKIKVGDIASATLDAYGTGTVFDASVISIDPAAVVQNGISSYKTTLEFIQNDPRIKEGMGANVIITDAVHQNALVIPASAVIKKNDQTFVLLSIGGNTLQQTQIETGILGLDGNIEVLSGLKEGDMIASFGNQ